jgi:hypothetical protein
METENNCPVCQCRGLVQKIFHSFVYHNDHDPSINHHHHCGNCGVNVTPTKDNRLDIGDEDRFKKAKFLFEETILVSLNRNYEETVLYYFSQKNQVAESRLYIRRGKYCVHITIDDFTERKPSHFFVKKTTKFY